MAKEREGERASGGGEIECEERTKERTEGKKGKKECVTSWVNEEMQTKYVLVFEIDKKYKELCEVREDTEISTLP